MCSYSVSAFNLFCIIITGSLYTISKATLCGFLEHWIRMLPNCIFLGFSHCVIWLKFQGKRIKSVAHLKFAPGVWLRFQPTQKCAITWRTDGYEEKYPLKCIVKQTEKIDQPGCNVDLRYHQSN